MDKVDIKFVLLHIPTQTEIVLPVLGICEEYSSVSFYASEKDYDGKYSGINRLPSAPGNDTADEYEVYVEINGLRHIYGGLLYSSIGDDFFTETKRQ